MLYDTHCHLNMMLRKDAGLYDIRDATDDEIKVVVQMAKEAGVSNIMQAGTFLSEIDREIDICKKFGDDDIKIFCAVANHPENVKQVGVVEAGKLIDIARKSPYIKAIGETGLDTHREENYDFLKEQIRSFENHIEACVATNLPLIIHAYGLEAIEKSIDIVCNLAKQESFKFVFHCYDGTYEQAKQIADCGGIISFSGTVTFKKKTIVKDILTRLPLDFIVIETDAPFLAPMPMRGKANEPSYIKYTAEFIANFLEMDYEKFCEKIMENSKRFFA